MAALLGGVGRVGSVFTGRSELLLNWNRLSVNPSRRIRFLRRKPVAVLHPDGELETRVRTNKPAERNTQSSDHLNLKHNLKQNLHQKHGGVNTPAAPRTSAQPHQPSPDPGLKVQLGGLRYETARPGDKRLAKVASIAQSRVFREQQGKVLLEGRRLICDALAAGASPQTLFFSRVERLGELPLDRLGQASLVKVKFEDIKIWSDLSAPQGVIAIFSKPDASRLKFPRDLRLQTVPFFLICDTIKDPGNLGTILRCAAAAGCERVLLNKGCVDAWEPKVLRAAMGAHFRLPIFPGLDWNDILEHLPHPVTVHVADPTNQLMMRQAVPQSGDTSCEEYVESDSEDESEDEGLPLSVEPKPYHENWAQRSTALVIGGEAHGLSCEALELAEETRGHKLFVPMAPGVECLNSAMTASILLFEGRRQLMKLVQKSSRRPVRSATRR
ncbi:rRNA methyltransferase 3, mitochondrial [Astyanax mexicanus]|uniref:rRNA methyltransferase 3, mitochondrial n=1 Tax=Astyanax mexicanus TaxID=7994 RepID=A0A8B9JUA0_ASTMX|nr:rRNA methyltransferase 3, mitochondrial [Astyanax mexicanus]